METPPSANRTLTAATAGVLVIDTVTDTVIGKIATDTGARQSRMHYSPDGSKILVSNNRPEGIVNILGAHDVSRRPIVLRVGDSPNGFAVAPDGKTALVANFGAGTVSIIDLEHSRVVREFPAPVGIDSLTFY